jgi:hypothetical protein
MGKNTECASCGHRKGNHELPTDEGGHGGGASGVCVTFSCNCRRFVDSGRELKQEYIGDPMPPWVREGVKVKVKKRWAKDAGIRVSGGSYGDNFAAPGEVGVIRKSDGSGWWSWGVEFGRGRSTSLTASDLEQFVRIKAK